MCLPQREVFDLLCFEIASLCDTSKSPRLAMCGLGLLRFSLVRAVCKIVTRYTSVISYSSISIACFLPF